VQQSTKVQQLVQQNKYFDAFLCFEWFFKFFKVNEYNTLGAKEYLQFYN
jgi:hypothetical protein